MTDKLIPLEIGPEIQCPKCGAWNVWEDYTHDWFECWACQWEIPPNPNTQAELVYTGILNGANNANIHKR